MLTRANIAYNLHISPHIAEVEYAKQVINYHFSSDLYRTKFLERLDQNRQNINHSINNRFGFYVDTDILADLRLYKSIEKRGYLISTDGDYIECQEKVKLDGMKLTQRS